jgi:citrate synthase
VQTFTLADSSCSDGEKGELRYRGVKIEDLVHGHDFDATMYLLIWGQLPTVEEKKKFEQRLANAASPPQQVCDVIRSLP